MEFKDNLRENHSKKRRIIILAGAITLFVLAVLSFLFVIFLNFPKINEDKIIHISRGEKLKEISLRFEEQDLVKNQKVFYFLVKSFTYDGRNIEIGDYKFNKNSSLLKIAYQLSSGDHNISPLKITLREGLTNEEMADILEKKISSFDRKLFLNSELSKQGYLFPDTYFFYPLTTTDEILNELSSNFENRIKKLQPQIEKSGKSLSEVIIMASIIEKEASGKDDAGIISGILWKRIEKGMPLQADASPITYKEKGLPSEPICNPGLSSIEASIDPINSTYLFYLHDEDGNVHFAGTYNEHKKNINEFLK